MRLAALVLLIAACTPAPPPSGDDDGTTTDSSMGGADGSTATTDGPPAVSMDVLSRCEPHTRTIVASDGRRTVQTYQWAVIDEVTLGDKFTVELCGPMPAPYEYTCATGSTCSGSIAPGGTYCTQHSVGTYFNNRLAIMCGSSYEAYDANGTLTSSSSNGYQSIRVTF